MSEEMPPKRRRGNPKFTREEVNISARLQMALDLRRAGHTYEEIAVLAGYSHRTNAHKDIHKALERYEAEKVEEYRAEELDRLNSYMQELAAKRLIGEDKIPNLDIYDILLNISKERRKLLGLDLKAEAGAYAPPIIRAYPAEWMDAV